MADSNDSVSVDMETIYLGGKEHIVRTAHGPVSVIVYGDQDKPALLTYPDLALNHMSCFQGLFFCPEAASLLLHNYCIYHISPPGHELGATAISPDVPVPSADDLADQIIEVLNYFRLGSVMCMGVTAGAYILTLFAIKYRERVLGLILVSPLCKSASWTEWLYNKVMSSLLYFYGMSGLLKEILLHRSSDVLFALSCIRKFAVVQKSQNRILFKHVEELVLSTILILVLLDERQSINVLRFLQAIDGRPDITEGLKRLKCRTLIFVGENSPFHSEALHMMAKLNRRYSALVEVQGCGSMVTEEQPPAMLIPMEYFLVGPNSSKQQQQKGEAREALLLLQIFNLVQQVLSHQIFDFSTASSLDSAEHLLRQ
ncbi:hypothetical protein TEA_017561 [Camellia sinensis var. sinensis]|uniref:Pollen-specific protein SF21 n=1 Tax=Camellia sinensis var. sinensis TaxID=542762 RepID=A0A4S4DCZ3_CAMSN|nr:hypothetical protein TEA_017561 [Camellia sinensis var. sinensis]